MLPANTTLSDLAHIEEVREIWIHRDGCKAVVLLSDRVGSWFPFVCEMADTIVRAVATPGRCWTRSEAARSTPLRDVRPVYLKDGTESATWYEVPLRQLRNASRPGAIKSMAR